MASTRDEADIDDNNASGNPLIDGLLHEYHWSLLARENFQFTMPDDDSDYRDTRDLLVNDYPDDGFEEVFAMPVYLKIAIRLAIDEYKNILNFAITEQGDNNVDTQLRYAITDFDHRDEDDRPPAYAFTPQDDGIDAEQDNWKSGDMFFNVDNFLNSPSANIVGTYEYHTVLHETGHALGLKHGHEAEDDFDRDPLPLAFDTMEFTVMTYRGYFNDVVQGGYEVAFGNYAQTLMMLDIQALKYLYGADFTTNGTDTTYRWQGDGSYRINGTLQWTPADDVIFLTIWDGGGEDTYDFSAIGTNQAIDLEPGKWSNLGSLIAVLGSAGQVARGNVFNSLLFNNDSRSIIENAEGGAGNDTISGNFGHNKLIGGAGNDDLRGLVGFDTLTGGAGNDDIAGAQGDDFITGGGGADTIKGGQGFDTAVYSDPSGDVVTITPIGTNDGRWQVAGPAQAAGDVLESIAAFVLGRGDDDITLNNSPQNRIVWIDGGGGDDRIAGSTGRTDTDKLIGGEGSDSIAPRAGAFDAYGGARRAGSATDWIERRADNDLLILDRSDYGAYYNFWRGSDGSLGTWTGFEEGSTARGFARLRYTGSDFRDDVYGGVGNDILTGNGGGDSFRGYEGHDLIFGGQGDDVLSGDAGDDSLDGGGGVDQLYGYEGNDVIQTGGAGTGFEGALGGLGNDNISGSVSRERLEGNEGNDILSGGADEDQVVGGAGNDTLEGGAGSDFVTGNDGTDTASYRTSNAAVRIDVATQAASGGHATGDRLESIESVIGSNFADTISGNGQANVLDGLAGNDRLSGGGGRDNFVFAAALGDTNVDRITDFNAALDTIRIDRTVFTGTGPAGRLAADRFVVGNGAADAQDRIVYNAATGALFYDSDGTGADAQIRFATLGTRLALTNADFVVI